MEEETLNNKILSYALNVLTESEVPILKAFLKRMGLGTPESLMELISSGVDNIGIDIDENGADFLIPNALKIDLIKQLSSLEGKEASEEEVEVFKKFWNALIVVQCNFFPEDNDTKLKLYDYLIGMTSDLGQIFDSESAQKHIKYFQNKKNIIPVSYPQPEPSLSSITLLEFKGEKKLKKLKQLLIDEGLIECDSDFLLHFWVDKVSQPSKTIDKIRWLGNMNELSDLYNGLLNLDLLNPKHLNNPYVTIKDHFCKKDGKNFDNQILSNRYRAIGLQISINNYPITDSYPRSVKTIREILAQL